MIDKSLDNQFTEDNDLLKSYLFEDEKLQKILLIIKDEANEFSIYFKDDIWKYTRLKCEPGLRTLKITHQYTDQKIQRIIEWSEPGQAFEKSYDSFEEFFEEIKKLIYWRVELILPSLKKEFDEDSDFSRLSESAYEWIDEEESKVLEEYGAGGMNMHIEWEPDDRGGLFTINLNYGFRYESHEYSIFEFDEFMGQIYDYVDWRLDSPAPS